MAQTYKIAEKFDGIPVDSLHCKADAQSGENAASSLKVAEAFRGGKHGPRCVGH